MNAAALLLAAATVLALPVPAEAAFRYIPPSAAALPAPEPLHAALRRLVPAGTALRYDARVPAGREVTHDYPHWRSLLHGEALAATRRGDELHVRPAGIAEATALMLAAGRGRATWHCRAGETVSALLARWSARAGLDLAWRSARDWRLDEARRFEGSFAEATARLQAALDHLPHPPVLSVAETPPRLVVVHRARDREPAAPAPRAAAPGPFAWLAAALARLLPAGAADPAPADLDEEHSP